MLQNLRDYFPKWFMALLLGLVGFLMIAGGFYGPYGRGSKLARTTLVQVNRKKIRVADVEHIYQQVQLQQNNEPNRPALSTKEQLQMWMTIVQDLVNKEVLKQQTQDAGYRTHPKDLQDKIKRIPEFQVRGRFSAERLKAILAASGYSKSKFFAGFREQYCIQQVLEAISLSGVTFPKEVNQLVRLAEQRRSFSYLQLPVKRFIPKTADISADEIKVHYDANRSQFRIPESASVEYLLFSRAKLLDTIKNVDASNKPVEQSTEEAFQAAMQYLNNIGKEKKALSVLSKQMQLPVESTPLFSRKGGSTEVMSHPEVIKIAFDSTIRDSKKTTVVQLDEDHILLVKPKDYQPLRLPALEEIESVVRDNLCLIKAKDKVKQYGDSIINALQKKDKVSADILTGLAWKKFENISRESTEIPPTVLQTVFSITVQGADPKVHGVILENGDYGIVHLHKVKYGQLSQLDNEQRDLYKKGLHAGMQQMDFRQYLESKERAMKITYNSSLR